MEDTKRPRQEKIVKGEVKVGEKHGFKAIAEEFIKEDARTVRSYLVYSVLIPKAKDILVSLVNSGLSMALYGKKGSPKSSDIPGERYSYSKPYRDDYREPDYRRRREPSYDSVVLSDYGEAEAVLNAMNDVIARYGRVSVLEMFDMLGQDCDYTQDKYGWKDLRNATIETVPDGFWIRLPKPKPI